MLRDWGSWDSDFRAMTAELRRRLLELAGDWAGEFECVPMQGSGTFAVEAMLGSFVPKDGKALVLANGAYGQRAAQTLAYLGRAHVVLDKGDYLPPRGAEIGELLDADPDITHVVVVHCETSSGILNPVAEISEAVYARGRKLLVDSMSAFGAIPLDVNEIRFEAMVSSANKCIEGVPGFGFVIARRSELEAAKGRSHSLSLDVFAQWDYMEKTGQWRFTPPTHAVAAFMEALRLHARRAAWPGGARAMPATATCWSKACGGSASRRCLSDRWLSPIIVTFFNPADPGFRFEAFYEAMKKRGFIIYPGKLTVVDSFRVGCIGHMDEHVMRRVVEAAGQSLKEMGVDSAAPPATPWKSVPGWPPETEEGEA
jgi:2-aminoethylphosphonate-pyruvate transaminase